MMTMKAFRMIMMVKRAKEVLEWILRAYKLRGCLV
jgi:hypothetical protein